MVKPSKGGDGGSGTISGNKRDNVLTGTSADEILDGNGGNDTLIGGGGNDIIIGGDGTDTAVFAFARDAYTVMVLADGSLQIAGPDGTATVSGVELFQFSDMTQSAAEVVIPREANLTAGAILVADTLLSPGETTSITASIGSNGVIGAAGTSAEFVFATAPDAGAIVGSLGSVDLAELATGSSETVTLTFDPATLDPGTYWVAVRADAGGAIDESNEADNLTEWVQITVEAPVADLKLSAATLGNGADLNLDGGGRIEIDYVIENASNTNVSYFKVVTYLSSDATASADDLRVAGATGGTYPGLTTSFTTGYTLQDDFAPGDYYLISVVEWGDGTQDATPQDNVIIQTITLVAPPPPTVDLAITAVSIDAGSDLDLGPDGYSWDGDGARLDLSIDLANYGSGDATQAGLTAYLSLDGVLSADDTAIWSGSVDLASGANMTIAASASVDIAFASGDYQVIVVASAADDIAPANDAGAALVTLIGGVDADAGSEGADYWVSGAGSDVVALLGGDDIAVASAGNDRVDGGDGFDTADFSGATEGMGVFFDGYNGVQLAAFPLSSERPYSTWANFERVILTDFDDQVSLAGGSAIELVLGGGNDVAEGSFGNDTIGGGAGDDFITGLFGDDILSTGDGFDFIGVMRDTSSGVATGFGNDSVEDFDVLADIVMIAVSNGATYDAFADLTQTADGALLNYAEGSSLLLRDVDVSDLTAQNFLITENDVVSYGY